MIEVNIQNLAAVPSVVYGILGLAFIVRGPLSLGRTVLAGGITLAQLKILQEVITLSVFVPFVMIYMRQPLKLDYLWAALCILGAVYFVFRK